MQREGLIGPIHWECGKEESRLHWHCPVDRGFRDSSHYCREIGEWVSPGQAWWYTCVRWSELLEFVIATGRSTCIYNRAYRRKAAAMGQKNWSHHDDHSSHKCHPSSSNHLSISPWKPGRTVVKKYIEDECAAGRILGPLLSLLYPSVHTSPFGVIPKPDKPRKWHLIILDLSYPEGTSVNTGIKKRRHHPYLMSQLTTLSRRYWSWGVGSLFTKIDIKNAFRLIPGQPQDRHLLGMKWQGALYNVHRLCPSIWSEVSPENF